MKKLAFIICCTFFTIHGNSQEKENTLKQTLLKSTAENACKCIDSISVYDKARNAVTKELTRCIDNQINAYQLSLKLMSVIDLKKTAEEKEGKREINISLNMDTASKEYKEYYYELERYMMENCKALKDKIAADDKQSEKSFSENTKALNLYSKGIDESQNGNLEKAIDCFKKAVKLDPQFAFAWDNLGICYRKLNKYDEALDAYKKSLAIDPMGAMPLQNIAIVYQYKKEYQNAIDSYQKLAEIDKSNPEIYYGIGQIYAVYLMEYEKGLRSMCKAYNLYVEQKSPYRTDAEKIIQTIYTEMKKLGKESEFNAILKENNITSN